MWHVTCHVPGARCQVSSVKCQVSLVFDKVVELAVGGLLLTVSILRSALNTSAQYNFGTQRDMQLKVKQ